MVSSVLGCPCCLVEQDGKIAVVVATVTDDVRLFEVPKIRVCALRFTETARARIVKVIVVAMRPPSSPDLHVPLVAIGPSGLENRQQPVVSTGVSWTESAPRRELGKAAARQKAQES
jgi:hypothetical protein